MVRHKRGNIKKEVDEIEMPLLTKIETQGLGAEDLKLAFEKIGDFKKPIPKLGRSKKSLEQR